MAFVSKFLQLEEVPEGQLDILTNDAKCFKEWGRRFQDIVISWVTKHKHNPSGARIDAKMPSNPVMDTVLDPLRVKCWV